MKLTYNSNGKGSAPAAATVIKGESVLLPSIGSVTGYHIDGWFTDKACTNKVGDAGNPYQVDAPIIIYAKWTANEYDITYVLNGGSIISGEVDKYTYGVGAILPTDVSGGASNKDFLGWYTNDTFSGSKVTKISTTDTGDKTYHAKIRKYYTITFDPGEEGQGTMASQKAYEGESTKLNKNTYTRSGYTIDNWSGSDGKTYTDGQTITVTSDLTLTVNWKEYHYNPGGGGGGSGGGGGGGGGGRISGDTIGNGPASNTTTVNSVTNPNKISVVKNEYSTTKFNYSQTQWTSDPISGKKHLLVTNGNGETNQYTNGFVVLTENKVVIENDQPVNIYATDTFYFDEAGNMVTGWLETADQNIYFFETANNSEEGKMAFDWKEIDGTWYCFSREGHLYRNTTTPDGYQVDVNGKWIR